MDGTYKFGQPVKVKKAKEDMGVEDSTYVKKFEGMEGSILRDMPYKKLQYTVIFGEDIGMYYHGELEAV